MHAKKVGFLQDLTQLFQQEGRNVGVVLRSAALILRAQGKNAEAYWTERVMRDYDRLKNDVRYGQNPQKIYVHHLTEGARRVAARLCEGGGTYILPTYPVKEGCSDLTEVLEKFAARAEAVLKKHQSMALPDQKTLDALAEDLMFGFEVLEVQRKAQERPRLEHKVELDMILSLRKDVEKEPALGPLRLNKIAENFRRVAEEIEKGIRRESERIEDLMGEGPPIKVAEFVERLRERALQCEKLAFHGHAPFVREATKGSSAERSPSACSRCSQFTRTHPADSPSRT